MDYYFRRIVFSKSPLKGRFRSGNNFQMYPCDFGNAPKNSTATHFPVVLEYCFKEKKNIIELMDFERKLLSFLSSIVNTCFFSYSTETFWGISTTKEDSLCMSEYFMKLYWYPEINNDMAINEFAEVTENVVFENHKTYYTLVGEEDINGELKLPETIFDITEKYFNLNEENRKVVDRAANLIASGVEMLSSKPSIAFVSFVSGIETLINYEYKDEKKQNCKECGTPQFKVTQKFKDFLRTYVAPSDNSMKLYGKIYDLCSKIIHQGVLLPSDEEFFNILSVEENGNLNVNINEIELVKKRSEILYTTRQMTRLALHNWLLMM